MTRRQVGGADAIAAALAAGEPVRLVLARRGAAGPRLDAVLAAAEAAGARVLRSSDAELRRLGADGQRHDALALCGATPAADLAEVLGRGGALWVACGLRFPGNTGFAIRTAEVSGADGIVVDAAFEGAGKRAALRASMYADRFFPVFWEPAGAALDRARAAGHRLVAVEDSGGSPPWETDLTGAVALVVGGERDGVPPDVLARCDVVVRLPMRGFVPSYNVQAAMAAVAAERLRQLG